MHIADGLLPVSVCIAADAAALGGVYLGGKNLDSDEIPRMGIFTAALFAVSIIHFPIGGTSLHLGLYGLAGMIFARRSFPILFVVLLFHSLIFQHGGLLSIGINTLSMACGALAASWLWGGFCFKPKIRSFLCGFVGVLLPALIISMIFVLLQYGKGMLFIMSVYLPAAVIEGVLTYFLFSFFDRVQPELLKR